MKKYKYYNHMTWSEDGTMMTLNTQMYSIGLYLVLYQDKRMIEQVGTDPKRFGKEQQKHIEAIRANPNAKDLVLGTEMVAFENADGYWESEEVVDPLTKATPRATYELKADPYDDGQMSNYQVYEADEIIEDIDDNFYARVTSEQELKDAVRNGEKFCGLIVKSYIRTSEKQK